MCGRTTTRGNGNGTHLGYGFVGIAQRGHGLEDAKHRSYSGYIVADSFFADRLAIFSFCGVEGPNLVLRR